MNAAHAVALKATDEVCRDLLWFMERFPSRQMRMRLNGCKAVRCAMSIGRRR